MERTADISLKINHPLPRGTPESQGMASAALFDLLERLSELKFMHSVMILRHGKVCLEAFWEPYRSEEPHAVFSVSKSFVSAALGLLHAEGRLKLTDRLADFFPEYRQWIRDAGIASVTLNDLLTMRNGHGTHHDFLEIPECPGDWSAGFFASTTGYRPGERFVYDSSGTYMLSALVRKLSGMNVREYLTGRLFDPLGITPGRWECCPRGINCGGWGLYLKTEDLARFAQLLLQKGIWNGTRILPADYLAEATAKQADTSFYPAPDWQAGYGRHFWMGRNGFRADGFAGQFALVFPEQDIAVAATAGLWNLRRVLEIFRETLLPFAASSPLAEDPVLQESLLEFSRSLSVPTAEGMMSRPAGEGPGAAVGPDGTEELEFAVDANPAGIRSLKLSFSRKECRLVFETETGKEELCAGFGFHVPGRLKLTDPYERPVGASAAWKSRDVLEIQVCNCDHSSRDLYRLGLAAPEFLRRMEQTSVFRPSFPSLILRKKS